MTTPRAPDADALFSAHFAQVHRFCAARVGTDAADDVTAEVFLTALRRLDRFDPVRGEARAWLLGIAVHVLHNRRRSVARRLRAMARLRADIEPDRADEVAERVDAARLARAVNTALDELRPADRDVLLLSAWGELTPDQIAVTLGVPAGTVRSRLSRARARMRSRLADDTSSGAPRPQEAAP